MLGDIAYGTDGKWCDRGQTSRVEDERWLKVVECVARAQGSKLA